MTIYTRASCGRTGDAYDLLDQARKRYPIKLNEVDITLDVTLEIAYGQDTPVILINGRERFRRHIDEHALNVILQTLQMNQQHRRRRQGGG